MLSGELIRFRQPRAPGRQDDAWLQRLQVVDRQIPGRGSHGSFRLCQLAELLTIIGARDLNLGTALFSRLLIVSFFLTRQLLPATARVIADENQQRGNLLPRLIIGKQLSY